MATETEVKLLVPDDVRLPELVDSPDGEVLVDPPSHHRLHATYYDCPDLRLVRSGTTVRFRSDRTVESDTTSGTWTVKRDRSADDLALSRTETEIGGTADAVPAQVRTLVEQDLAGGQLGPVAEVHTDRTRVLLRDGLGTPLVEFVDDRVTARPADAAPVSFHEVELELLSDEPAAREVQRDLTSLLRAAGCVAGEPLPKVVRALGPRARG